MVSAAIASSPKVTSIDGKGVHISIIVPIYNEVGNIRIIVPRLISALQIMPHRFEIIAVNDGSQDESSQELMEQAENHPELKIIDFRRNYGQTAAIMAGIDHAIGDVIVTIDADLQNDPDDIGFYSLLLNVATMSLAAGVGSERIIRSSAICRAISQIF